eukprot:scaffold55276_cov55-Attheya_sp.AAC.6
MSHFLCHVSTLLLLGVILVWVKQPQPVEALIAAGGVKNHNIANSRNSPTIRVTCVTSSMDVRALADLRFTEWIMTDEEDGTTTDSDSDSRPTPSAQAFRMATAEITAERRAQGAVAVIAQTTDGTAVGAAELSPIELQQCVLHDATLSSSEDGVLVGQEDYYYYVTDVVTARTHRRMGVGKALMEAIEQEASKSNKGATATTTITTTTAWLLLHVKEDNGAALHFYKRGGYLEPPPQLLHKLDTDRLARNAGTIGQILLSKPIPITLDSPPISNNKQETNHPRKEQRTNNSGGGGGFGGKNLARKKQPKKPSR